MVGAAATASKLWALLAIETRAHNDEEVICLYIDTWIRKQKLSKTLVDSNAVVELISWKVVYDLNLSICRMDKKWTLQLVDDRHAIIQEYVWVMVNVVGVQALVKALF